MKKLMLNFVFSSMLVGVVFMWFWLIYVVGFYSLCLEN